MHWVTTKETFFQSLPSPDKIKRVTERGNNRVLKDDEVSIIIYLSF